MNTNHSRRTLSSFFYILCLAAVTAVSCGRGNGEKTAQEHRTPLMGWSSWNTYYTDISDSLIRKQAEAMVSTGLKEAGYNHINIDDGLFGLRDAEGNMTPNPLRFPDGLKVVADHIHSLGLKAGFYSEAGRRTCAGMFREPVWGAEAGLYGHDAQDFNRYFNEWGYDYIKIDYCGGNNLGLDERQRYTEICTTLRKTARKPVRINICRWAFPGTWAADLADSWRISGDIRPTWASIRSIIDKNKYLSAFARNWKYNDMDMLEIGRGLPAHVEQVHFGFWCLQCSPLVIGCDLTSLPEASLNLLKNKELIALNQDPLGRQAYIAQREGDNYVFVKDLLENHGLVRAVALYNPTEEARLFSVPMERLELGGKVRLRDLVKQEDLPEITDGLLEYTLSPESALFLKAECEKRTEASRYEAEWAYLPLYQDIGKKKHPIGVLEDDTASGGALVRNIGGTADNFMEWDRIWSEEGGEYELTVWYRSEDRTDQDRLMRLQVNEEEPFYVSGLVRSDEPRLLPVTVRIRLHKGDNRLRIGSPYAWCPDIDCIELAR